MTTRKHRFANLNSLQKRLGPMTVGSFLRAWRQSEDMTQRDFAEMLGMSPANLCDIEKERKGVSLEKAEEIAEIIGYSPTVLLGLAFSEQLRDAGLEYTVEVRPRSKKVTNQ